MFAVVRAAICAEVSAPTCAVVKLWTSDVASPAMVLVGNAAIWAVVKLLIAT
jgi:hypothetical protein